MVKINIHPLSVNEAWKGKRFKTPKYKQYENDLLLLLPKIKLPEPPYKIYLNFGFSNKLSDWDNPIKPFVDVLQKRYDFNDRDIFEATIKKFKVEKGKEYVKFLIETVEKF